MNAVRKQLILPLWLRLLNMIIKMAQRMALRYALARKVYGVKIKQGVIIDNVDTLTSENVMGLLRDKCIDTVTIYERTYKVAYGKVK
jgi:hypothetical protein